MGKRNIHKILFFLLLQSCGLLYGQLTSVFNKASSHADSSGNFSFIVSGHFHGASSNQSTFPAATLLANIDTLNSLKPLFIVSLGDLFLDVNDAYIEHYQKSFFNKLNVPLYNAVGNHDLSNGNLYEKIYGDTYYKFSVNGNLFIVLNTEMNDGSIKGPQMEFFNEALKDNSQFRNIFIFSHRPVWAENNERYKKLFPGNTRTAIGSNNFDSEIKPLLSKLSQARNVFWMSGSLGGGPASFFYDKDPETKITFMQTAIRDLPRDAVLQVNVNRGNVSFRGVSLTGQQLENIESYGLDYWNKTVVPETRFNYRLLPYIAFQMVCHYYFWSGFFTSVIFLLIISLIVKKWKRKK